jgi:hypothetical protein
VTAVAHLAIALCVITVGPFACRQGDPLIDPKTPVNSPLPTKLERPDDPVVTPKSAPDAG